MIYITISPANVMSRADGATTPTVGWSAGSLEYNVREVEIPPEPQLMESMRAVGYTLETAVADIVDNSVSAEAGRVDIYFISATPDYLAILDDGWGMSPQEVQSAMRLAGRGANAARSPSDLGRFGLGMKTASLSQCRTLTVVSRRNGETSGYTWSLDHLAKVGRWALIELTASEIRDLPRGREFSELEHGTLVLWRDLDNLAAAPGTTSRSLDEAIRRTRDHLALVFHRYLSGEHGAPFTVSLNGRAIPRFDPFLKDHRATQYGPLESFTVGAETVTVRPYTLPFITKLRPADRERSGVDSTLRESQGFYIYRNMRLVIWGTWFRIVPKDDIGRLARVQVDIPNSLDNLWALDIKKSAAVPPPAIRTELRRLAGKIVEPSRKVHHFRGRNASADGVTRIWNLINDRDGFRYEINREHPAIRNLSEDLNEAGARDVSRALTLIESTFPVHDAYNRIGGDERPSIDRVDDEEIIALARRLWEIDSAQGRTRDIFIQTLKLVEPFCHSPNPVSILEKASSS